MWREKCIAQVSSVEKWETPKFVRGLIGVTQFRVQLFVAFLDTKTQVWAIIHANRVEKINKSKEGSKHVGHQE